MRRRLIDARRSVAGLGAIYSRLCLLAGRFGLLPLGDYTSASLAQVYGKYLSTLLPKSHTLGH